MKILFVDVEEKGHHAIYLQALVNSFKGSCLVLVPKRNDAIKCKQIVNDNINLTSKKFRDYLKLINYVKEIVNENNVDIIHFLYGDIIYRFGGIYFNSIKKPVIMTFHLQKENYLYKIRMKKMMKKINLGIVHSLELNDKLVEFGINNVNYIDYPNFNSEFNFDQDYARRFLGIPKNVKVIAALGGTRENKGLDVLLRALGKVSDPFCLLIAGDEQYFSYEFIKQEIKSYQNSVITILRYLSDEEMSLCVASSDIIVLPYKKSFNGASGPLVEGVWNRKLIIGSSHGNIGRLIKQHRLGYIFQTDNSDDLAKILHKSLQFETNWNQVAESYREGLIPEKFCDSLKTTYEKLYK